MKRFLQSIFGGHTDILTPAQFTNEFVEALRASSPELKVKVTNDLELELTTTGGKKITSYLYNAYDNYKTDPRLKAGALNRFVSSLLETVADSQSSQKLDPARIVPVIKDRPWLEETKKALMDRGAEKLPKNVYDDLNDHLIILYAEDSPKNVRYFGPEDLAEAQIDRKDLRSLACQNLKKLLPKIERHGGNGLYMIAAGGDYEASLLLLDKLWDEMKSEVKGDVVAAIPTRDLLIVTGSEDAEGIQRMKKIIEDATAKGSYRLTRKMFVYREGKFGEFLET
jgi:uncharacterized protein YtpQ (UPF0354 family)